MAGASSVEHRSRCAQPFFTFEAAGLVPGQQPSTSERCTEALPALPSAGQCACSAAGGISFVLTTDDHSNIEPLCKTFLTRIFQSFVLFMAGRSSAFLISQQTPSTRSN